MEKLEEGIFKLNEIVFVRRQNIKRYNIEQVFIKASQIRLEPLLVQEQKSFGMVEL